jgi:hypothetical protein
VRWKRPGHLVEASDPSAGQLNRTQCTTDRRFSEFFHWVMLDHPPQTVIWLDHWSNSWDVTDSITLMKRKWLFLNGRECKDLISATTELLNLSQDEENASICSRIMFKIDTALERMRYI